MHGSLLNKILACVLVVALFAAGHAAWKRHVMERDHREVELALVYSEVADLAQTRQGTSALDLLASFRRYGVTTVLFKEDTPSMLEARGEFVIGKLNELQVILPGLFPRGTVDPAVTCFLTYNEEAWNRVAEVMRAKGLPATREKLGNGRYAILTPVSEDKLEQWGLGFPWHLVKEVAGLELNVLVQLRTWPEVDGREIKNFCGQLAGVPNLAGILFNDDKLPAYKDKELMRLLGAEINKLDVPLVQIEFFNQQGFNKLARLVDKHVVRLHSIAPEEMSQYQPGEALNRYELAVTDRNIRVVLFRLFSGVEYKDLLVTNLENVRQLRASLENKGFHFGRAALFNPLVVPKWQVFLMGLGVLAGGLWLCRKLFPPRWLPLFALAGLAGWTGLVALGFINQEYYVLGRKMAALAAVIVFPALAVMWGVTAKPLSPARAVLRLLQVTIFSLAGALLMVGLLADVSFMLKLDQFTGVKVAHLLPLVLVGGYFFLAVSPAEHWRHKVERVLKSPVTVAPVAVAAFLGGVLLLYLIRTGNTDVGAVLPLEQQLRTLLEEALQVRPRTKEFLLGHPLLLLLLYTGYRSDRFLPFLVLGVIGQVSIVNTFAHIHTPLVISLLRGLNGLWLGVLGGLALIAAWKLGQFLYHRVGRQL